MPVTKRGLAIAMTLGLLTAAVAVGAGFLAASYAEDWFTKLALFAGMSYASFWGFIDLLEMRRTQLIAEINKPKDERVEWKTPLLVAGMAFWSPIHGFQIEVVRPAVRMFSR